MTVVDVATGEVVEYDRAAAERRAERIVLRLDAIAENYARVLPMIREAIAKRDDIALGYRSPGEYVADRFGQSLAGLGIETRRAVVHELSQAGMSTRAIAPVVGVSQPTVLSDQRAGDKGLSPDPQTPSSESRGEAGSDEGQTSTPEVPHADAASGVDRQEDVETAPEVGAESSPEGGVECDRPPVIGRDGKTYTRRTRPTPTPEVDDVFTDQERAEELSRNLTKHVSLLYAVTVPERRAEFIAAWPEGTKRTPWLGQEFVTPDHFRRLADGLHDLADEWEHHDD